MIKNHPFQFIYFNTFAGKNVENNFELDYWGTSNRSALNYIANLDKKNNINVYAASVSPYDFSLLLLNHEDRKRIKFVNKIENANFLVTNHYYQEGNPTSINQKLDFKITLLLTNSGGVFLCPNIVKNPL